jgi:AcrR family transcriptional regulator
LVSPRRYRLGRRQGEVERTRSAILTAARELVTEFGPGSSVGKVAERAGVSRITVYNQFGSKERLLDALEADATPGAPADPADSVGSGPRDELKRRILQACTAWAADPGLHRQLEGRRTGPAHQGRGDPRGEESDVDHALVESLAAHDQLRLGCSLKEAEDVLGILTSFAAFDRLHKGGRRSPSAVSEILMRMAAEFLA